MPRLHSVLSLVLLALFARNVTFASGGRPVRIALAGDSTVSNFPADRPERGWGVFLGPCFDSQVTVENFAKPGRSTKTFLAEGLWDKVIASHPDYILIQFGHNDSHAAERPEHTDPNGLYAELLRRFVQEARAAGAVPVLVTPVQRRTPKDTLLPYVAAMKQVAAATHTPVVDLHRLSGELYSQIGPAAQEQLGATKTDTTHFSPAGAKRIAALVAHALGQAVPALRPHLQESNRCGALEKCAERIFRRNCAEAVGKISPGQPEQGTRLTPNDALAGRNRLSRGASGMATKPIGSRFRRPQPGCG